MFGLFRGADGLPWYQGVAEGSGVIAAGVVGSDGSLVPAAVANMPSKLLPFPAPVYYTFGDFTVNPEVGAQKAVAGLSHDFCSAAIPAMSRRLAEARRTVFEQEPPATPQGVVIGIFDSGPPIPNQNLAGLSANSTLGTTTFGETTSNTTCTGRSIRRLADSSECSSSAGMPGIFSVTQQFKVTPGCQRRVFAAGKSQPDHQLHRDGFDHHG